MTAPTYAGVSPATMTNHSAPLAFLRALHRDDAGELAVFSARRSKDRLVEPRTDYFTLPDQAEAAATHALTEAAKGRETYACAHQLTERRRVKEAAAPVTALWADGDGGHIPATFPAPSVRVASSPGREQWYWRLTRPIAPARAEDLNRRIARLTGADASGWDLGQLLRIPGTPNRKYPDAPLVRILHAGPEAYDPDELDRLLPPLPPPPTAGSKATTTVITDSGDEPPVRLDVAGLALWRGESFARKHDAPAEVDRSESLWRLACVLDEAGATGSTIATALAERDMTLGWEKYTGRRDAAEQYAAIVSKLKQRDRPAPPPPPDTGAPSDDFAQLRRERDEARAALSMAIQVCLNPNLKATEKVAYVAAVGLAQQKRDRGEVEPDGTILLSAAEIADDWRAAPETGEHVAPTNPDGSRPRMSREQVRPILKAATERGILPASPRPTVRRRADGSTFKDTGWAFAAPNSISAFLAPAASWRPEQPVLRKPRRLPCPHCNEVHAIVRKDYCQGCGSLRHETIIEPTPETPSDDQQSPQTPLRKNIGQGEKPTSSLIARKNIGGANAAVASEPAHLAYLLAPGSLDHSPDGAHARPSP